MDLLATGKQVAALIKQKARALEEDLKARREVEVAGMAAGVRARLEQQVTLLPLSIDGDLADHRGPLQIGRVRTEAWHTEQLRKVVLTHVALPPIIEGFALTLIPAQHLDFPIFAADLMALPTRVSVNADVYGSEWQTRKVLDSLRVSFRRLGSDAGPVWTQRISSGQGLHSKLNPRMVDEGFAALTQALLRYIEDLRDAPPGRSTDGQTQFFQAFHQNGPRKGPLGRLMGEAWTERYSRLIFE